MVDEHVCKPKNEQYNNNVDSTSNVEIRGLITPLFPVPWYKVIVGRCNEKNQNEIWAVLNNPVVLDGNQKLRWDCT